MGMCMSSRPMLLLLHGVGKGIANNQWQDTLSHNLVDLGYPDLTEVEIIAPKYEFLLKGCDEEINIPPVTVSELKGAAAKQNRRDCERRTSVLEMRLGRHDHGPGGIGPKIVQGVALDAPRVFEQARNYLRDSNIRGAVLSRILSKLPDEGEVLIIGHSLGSVIAADLLRRLPEGLRVRGMITIGSPLANAHFNVGTLGEDLADPPSNVTWWVNMWSMTDPVAAWRGVSSAFPWVLDHRVSTTVSPINAHNAAQYLQGSTLGDIVGWTLFGSLSKELVLAGKNIDIPLDTTEQIALYGLRYSFLIERRLKGEVLERYAGARRQVQAGVVEDIRQRNLSQGRGMPSLLADLDFNLADVDAVAPEPAPCGHLSKEDAVIHVLALATENVIKPFDIAVGTKAQQEALQDLTSELGLSSFFGVQACEAIKEAQGILSGPTMEKWVKWGAVGAGAVALIVASGGMVLAAGPGLAGAAAITSALATFGPGGMVGGLLTAGTLMTAGGGSLAIGLANPSTSAKVLESVILVSLAAVILRKKEKLEQDDSIWQTLAQSEMILRREHERLDEFVDKTSSGLKELKRKLKIIERAMDYMVKNHLAPLAIKEEEEKRMLRVRAAR